MPELRRVRYVGTFKDHQDEDYYLFAYVELPDGLIPPPVLLIHQPLVGTFEFVMDTTRRVEDA